MTDTGTDRNGFEEPNYTQVPNILLEKMAELSDAELRCTLALIRKIIGYHKEHPEAMSYSQLMEMTGLSRQGVRNGIKAALDRGTVKVSGSGKQGVKLYTLNFVDMSDKLVNVVDQSTELTATSQRSRPQLVNVVDTQKKRKEKKEIKTAPAPAAPDPDTADDGAEPSDDGQRGAGVVETYLQDWLEKGYQIGMVAYWWYPDGNKYVPGKIVKLTQHFAYFESVNKMGQTVIQKVGEKRCSLTGQTDGWTLVKDLDPIQHEIAVGSYEMTDDQCVSGQRMEEINMHRADLREQFKNGQSVEALELRAAYGHHAAQKLSPPKRRGAVADMVNAYRKTTRSGPGTPIQAEPTAYDEADPRCTRCNGTGLIGTLRDNDPCPQCRPDAYKAKRGLIA